MTERFSFADMVILAVERFANHIPLNVQSIFVWYMEQKGVENPERFLQSGMEIPLEVQQILLQNPAVQELINNIQAQKANNKPNIPDSAEIPRNTPESKMQIYE